jgi:hypothetical protein
VVFLSSYHISYRLSSTFVTHLYPLDRPLIKIVNKIVFYLLFIIIIYASFFG